MVLVRNVPDIGMGAGHGDLAGAGEIEMSEPADVVGERRLPINLVHVRFRPPASCLRWAFAELLPSPTGLPRGSTIFARRRIGLPKQMDCRVKPANDGESIVH